MVEQPPKDEETGIEFDLDSAQAANEAAEAAAAKDAPAKSKPGAPNIESATSARDTAPSSAEASGTQTTDASTAPEKPSAVAKFFADEGPFMRFVWWTLRTTSSFVVPLGIFYAMENCAPLVSSAYKMLNPGVSPYPLLMKGELAQFLGMLIAGVPAFFGMWLGAVLAKFKSWKPIIAVAVWCLIMFPFTLVFVVVAKYFHII